MEILKILIYKNIYIFYLCIIQIFSLISLDISLIKNNAKVGSQIAKDLAYLKSEAKNESSYISLRDKPNQSNQISQGNKPSHVESQVSFIDMVSLLLLIF